MRSSTLNIQRGDISLVSQMLDLIIRTSLEKIGRLLF
jgi:hypothetical protein